MPRPSQYPNPRDQRGVPAPVYRPAPTAAPEPAAAGPGPALWVGIGVGVVLFVVAIAVVFRLARKPRDTVAADVPAGFFQQASADFAEARRLLEEGRLNESAEKFEEAQAYRRKAADKTVGATQTFEQGCAAREREYRAAASASVPTLAEKVATGRPSVAEVDTFLQRFATDAARAEWQQQRPAAEKAANAAIVAGAYRVEWTIKGVEGNSMEDLKPADFAPLADAIAAKIGAGPLLPAANAPGVPPEQGLGYVHVTLTYLEARYRARLTGRESDIQVPTVLDATIEVTTNQKKGQWDGVHEYTAQVDPPRQLKEEQIATTRGTMQRALLKQVVEQITQPTRRRLKER